MANIYQLLATGNWRPVTVFFLLFSTFSLFPSAKQAPLQLSFFLYICRENTTNQTFFMQNEPNFLESQMNVTKETKKDYEKKDTWWSGKNEPKTNPIRTQTNPNKANLQKAQISVTKVLTEDYEKISNWAIYPKQSQTKPIQTQFKANRSQNEPNQSQFTRPQPFLPIQTIRIFYILLINNNAKGIFAVMEGSKNE